MTRYLTLVLACAALALISATAFSRASGYPPLPRSARFEAITPRNIEQVRNRLDGSANERNQIPAGTVLAFRTSSGNDGKLQILEYGYNLRIKWVTYLPDGKIASRGTNFLVKGTFSYDLDTGQESGSFQNAAADFFWEQVTDKQRYLDFLNRASFTIVS